MTWKGLLGLTVLGACVTTAGSLLALYIKEFVAARWLEQWKARQTLLGIYRRYQLPIFLAAEELSGRLYGLSREDNDREERAIGLEQLKNPATRELHAAISEHYLRYRFVSNVYRLCTFIAWLELYRRDIGTLDTGQIDRNRQLDACLRNIQCALADGWINQHDDWREWKDCLLYREEQRAIGSAMAVPGDALRVLDFGEFTISWREIRMALAMQSGSSKLPISSTVYSARRTSGCQDADAGYLPDGPDGTAAAWPN